MSENKQQQQQHCVCDVMLTVMCSALMITTTAAFELIRVHNNMFHNVVGLMQEIFNFEINLVILKGFFLTLFVTIIN